MQKLLTSLNDVEIVKDPGSQNDLLGYGALSMVRKVRHKPTGKLFALKEMDLKAIHPNDVKNIKQEVKTHIGLDHPNIVKLYDNHMSKDHILSLLLEYCDNNNLFHYIQKHKVDEKVIHKFFYQTLQAIEYIHQRKIMHRDLKPENILLDKNFNVKVCDFGWCAEYNEDERRQTFCGTNEYMAPEIFETKTQDFGIDIWALGILLFEMYHKRAPFTGKSPSDMLNAIRRRKLVFTANPMCHEAKDLIDKILQIDPKRRITIEGMYHHPYFSKFPFFRLKSNDSKTIAAKNSRSSYIRQDDERELQNSLMKKNRAPSPGHQRDEALAATKPSGTQPIKIVSYNDASLISNKPPGTVLTGTTSMPTSSGISEMRPKAMTTMAALGSTPITPTIISSSATNKNGIDNYQVGVSRPQYTTPVSTSTQISHPLTGVSSLNSSDVSKPNQSNIVQSMSTPTNHMGTIISSSIPNKYDFTKPHSQPTIVQAGPINDRSDQKDDTLGGVHQSAERGKAPVEYKHYRHDSGHQREEDKPGQSSHNMQQSTYQFTPGYQNTPSTQIISKDSNSIPKQGHSSHGVHQPSHLTSTTNQPIVSGNYQATSYTSPGQVISGNPHTLINNGSLSSLGTTLLPSSNSF